MIVKIKNANVLNETATGFVVKDVFIEDDRFSATKEQMDNVIDAKGLYLLPGMIDIHTHGAKGVSFNEINDDISSSRIWFAQKGVTAILPTIATMPLKDTIKTEQNILNHGCRCEGQASIVGIHLEGPFLSAEKRGAMVLCNDECNIENFKAMIEGGDGNVRIMTIAPEVQNAQEVVRYGASLGVRMSMGHTNVTYMQSKNAIEWGYSGVTHLYNGMRGFSHREPGILGTAWLDERLTCELIADFVHSAPEAVWLAYRLLGKERLIVISDTGKMSGVGEGVYDDDGRKVIVKDGQCRNEEGNLTNSMLAISDSAKNLLSLGVPLHEIAYMTSTLPAKVIGIEKDYGTIAEGKYADFILCDKNLKINAVFIGGKRVEQ